MAVHHIAINTGDYDRMVGFYRDVLGFALVHEGSWTDRPEADRTIGLAGSAARQAIFDAGNLFVELFSFSAPPAADRPPLRPCDRGYTHFCVDVGDLDAAYARMTAAGMRFVHPPTDFGRWKSSYGFDPDGNVIEVQQVVDPDCHMSMARLGPPPRKEPQ